MGDGPTERTEQMGPRKANILALEHPLDTVGTDALNQTAARFFQGLRSSTQADRELFEADLSRTSPFLAALQQAISGQLPKFSHPLLRQARDELRREESNVAQNIRENAAALGGRGQFGLQKLLAQNASQFGQQDAALAPRLTTDIIRNFLPVLQGVIQARQHGLDRATQTAGGAFEGALNFQAPSTRKSTHQLNLARASGAEGGHSIGSKRGPSFLSSLASSAAGGLTGGFSGSFGQGFGKIFGEKIF